MGLSSALASQVRNAYFFLKQKKIPQHLRKLGQEPQLGLEVEASLGKAMGHTQTCPSKWREAAFRAKEMAQWVKRLPV